MEGGTEREGGRGRERDRGGIESRKIERTGYTGAYGEKGNENTRPRFLAVETRNVIVVATKIVKQGKKEKII